MFIISKIITAFLLPPGIFIIFLLLFALKSKQRKRLIFLGVFIWIISIKPISNLFLYPLENIKPLNKKAPFVVVLGGGIVNKDIFKSSPHQFKRVIYGVIIAKKNNIPLIFTGGGVGNEANGVKHDIDYLEKSFNFKIKTYFENKSKNTKQNAYLTAKLFQKHHFKKKIYLVTSAFHMKRAMIDFKKAGFKIIPKPTDFLSNYHYVWYDFLPSMDYLYKTYLALHEYLGIIKAKFLD